MKNKRLSTRQEKIDWLIKHSLLWEAWCGSMDRRSESIIKKMKEDGLISENTHHYDVCLSNLIADARKQRRLKGKDLVRIVREKDSI